MTTDHEYSAVGHSRTRIGRVLGALAGAIAGGIAAGAGFLTDWLATRGIFDPPSYILWPVSGFVVFSVIYFIFDKIIWPIQKISKAIGVPNLNGKWNVFGETYDSDGSITYEWQGTIEITQNYEKIHVFLRTAQSSSNSIAAAIIPEGNVGYRLIYSYRNTPKAGEAELAPHVGHADLLFVNDLSTADGSYFNGIGRNTFGRMRLEKEVIE